MLEVGSSVAEDLDKREEVLVVSKLNELGHLEEVKVVTRFP